MVHSFSSHEFQRFAEEANFKHATTSPHYSQANGQTERYVQTVKKLIQKSDDPSKVFLDYRNTPLEGINLSPAQLHIGRRLKSSLPTRTELLKPKYTSPKKVLQRYKQRQASQEHYYNQNSGPKLKPLLQGQTVTIRHDGKIIPGTVVRRHNAPRSFIVETKEGRILRRNRRHLRPTSAEFQDNPQEPYSSGTHQFSKEQENSENISNQSSNLEISADNSVPEVACENADLSGTKTTRSGRNVKMPSKYDEYVCNPLNPVIVYV
ncbi:uncharacterized protein LOC127840779 [Dreissena polymorpha]|uniref:uncharacterized protein LOC127840779 n=1 Tax=Dreissena polymorpha TaxID=45954 RepID=UPI002264465C|nr:uncharacterized protein LOC127840779 [Dreissena polymorpha]